MKTIFINGSPHGRQGNSEIFIRQLMIGMNVVSDVLYVNTHQYDELADQAALADRLIFVMPLYVHAMPGIVMKLFEVMKPAKKGAQILFVVQAARGVADDHVEAAQSAYCVKALKHQAARLGYECLGVVVRGNSAGVSLMPEKANRKLFEDLQALGQRLAETGELDEMIAARLGDPYRLSRQKLCQLQLLSRLGLGDLYWQYMLRKNHAYKKRFERPFGR